MASVDDRIVRMEFDNAAFEKKIQSTITSLGQLNNALKMTEATKGLAEVGAAAQKTDLAPMHAGVEGLSAKFIALSTIAITALSKITTKAMETGTQLIKSLTLEPVAAGFAEYELKMGAIQTIMAGSGESLDVVNAKLQELNDYSDKTIYSFKDMTQNIGKFTNAGISLDASVASIQGIANVAAVSGANADEAARAMYNFAQALSKGHVQLIDWKSIEMANMGTKEFKQQLIDAAVATGTLTKKGGEYVTSAGNALTATKGFNDTLKDEWLTTEVLNSTLGDYADETTAIGKKAFAAAQDIKTFSQLLQTVRESVGSGWAKSFELVIGNLEQSKDLFTLVGGAVQNFLGQFEDARNALLAGWNFLGGRNVLIEGMVTAWLNLGNVLRTIKEAFREVFPATTALQLVEMTQSFTDFMHRITASPASLEKLKTIFKGIFSVLEIGWTVIKEGIKFVGTLFDILTGASKGPILDVGARLAEIPIKLNDILVTGGAIKSFFEGLADGARMAAEFIREFYNSLVDMFTGTKDVSTGGLKDSVDGLASSAEGLSTAGNKISEFFTAVKEGFQDFINDFKAGVEETGDLAGSFGEALSKGLESENFQKVLNVFQTGILGGFMLAIRRIAKNGLKLNFLSGLAGPLDQLTKTLKTMQTQVKVGSLLRIAIAVGILAASLFVLSTIETGKLYTALGGLTAVFALLLGSLFAINKMTSGKDAIGGAKFALMSVGFLILAGSILLLAVAVKLLGSMDLKTLGVGLGAVLVIIGEFILLAKMLGKYQADMYKAGLGILAISAAILILSFAMTRIGDMPLSTIVTSMVTMAAALGIFVFAINRIKDDLDVSTGLAILAMSASILVLAFAFQKIGALDVGDIVAGLGAMAGALALMVGAMRLMPKDDMAKIGLSMLAMSVSIYIIGSAIKKLGSLPFGNMALAIGGLVIVLLAMALAANAMEGTAGGAAAILVISGALYILAEALTIIGQLGIGQIVTSFGVLIAALLLFTVAAVALFDSGAIIALAALAAVLAVVGIAMLAFGAGVYLAVRGIQILASMGVDGIKTFTEILEALGEALPYLIRQFAEGIIDLIDLIAQAAPEIAENIVEIFSAILTKFQELIPLVGMLFDLMLQEIIRIVSTYFPQFIQLGINLISQFLLGIRASLPFFTAIVADIVITFINQLKVYVPQIVKAGTDLIIAIIKGIGMAHIRVMQAIGTLITVFLTSLRGQVNRIISAGTQLIIDFMLGIQRSANKVIAVGVATVLSFLQGLGKNALKLANGAAEVLIDFLEGLESAIRTQGPRIKKAGVGVVDALIDGMVDGVGDLGGAAIDAMTDLAGGMVDGVKGIFGIGCPSKVFMGIGGNIVDGLAIGVDKGAPEMSKTMVKMAVNTVDSYADAMKFAVAHVEGMTDLNPVITPVLDLSLIERDAQKLAGYVDTSNTLTPTVSLGQATSIASTALKAAPTETPVSTPGEIKFEQNIYAPEQLSTADIYKQTRNQITIAKEELSIP